MNINNHWPIGDKTDEIAQLAQDKYGVHFGRAKNILRYWAQFHRRKAPASTPDKEDWFMIFRIFIREFRYIRINPSTKERYLDGQRYNEDYPPPWPMVKFPKEIPFGHSVIFSRHHRSDASRRHEINEITMGVKVLSDMIKNFTLLKRSGKIGVYRDYGRIVGLLKKVVKPPQTPEELARDARIRRDNNSLAIPKQIKLIF